MHMVYTVTLPPCPGSGTLFRDWDQCGAPQYKADTDILEQGQGLGCREGILPRKGFVHSESSVAWDIQTFMGRQTGSL